MDLTHNPDPHTLIISLLIYGNLRKGSYFTLAPTPPPLSRGVHRQHSDTAHLSGGGQSAAVSSVKFPCPCSCPAAVHGAAGRTLLSYGTAHTHLFPCLHSTFFFFSLPHISFFYGFIHSFVIYFFILFTGFSKIHTIFICFLLFCFTHTAL